MSARRSAVSGVVSASEDHRVAGGQVRGRCPRRSGPLHPAAADVRTAFRRPVREGSSSGEPRPARRMSRSRRTAPRRSSLPARPVAPRLRPGPCHAGRTDRTRRAGPLHRGTNRSHGTPDLLPSAASAASAKPAVGTPLLGSGTLTALSGQHRNTRHHQRPRSPGRISHGSPHRFRLAGGCRSGPRRRHRRRRADPAPDPGGRRPDRVRDRPLDSPAAACRW
jgi:hypothetical protein